MQLNQHQLTRRQMLKSFGLAGVALATGNLLNPIQTAFATDTASPAQFNVRDFGAVGDGVADDSAAIQNAINEAAKSGGVVYLPAGTYLLATVTGSNHVLLQPRSNVTLLGDGDLSVLKAADNLNRDKNGFNMIFPAESGDRTVIQKVAFRSFKVDLNGTHNTINSLSAKNAAIGLRYADDVLIENVTVVDNAGQQTFSFGNGTKPHQVKNLRILNCRVNTVGNAVLGNTQTDHSVIYAEADTCQIQGNLITNPVKYNKETAIECHSSNAVVTGNVIQNFNIGFNVVATVTDQINSIYSSNTVKGVNTGFMFWVYPGMTMSNVLLDGNLVEQDADLPAIVDLDSNVQSLLTDVKLVNNTFTNTYSAPTARTALGVKIGRVGVCTIQSNTFQNLIGRAISAGTFLDNELMLTIDNNQIYDCGRTTTNDTYKYAIALFSLYTIKSLLITNNQIINRTGTTMTKAIHGNAKLTNAEFRSNTITGLPAEIGWEDGVTIDWLYIDHNGQSTPEGKVRASVSSRWVIKSTGVVYTKKANGTKSTGWQAEA